MRQEQTSVTGGLRRSYLGPALALGLGLFFSVSSWLYLVELEEDRVRASLRAQTAQIAQAIESRVTNHVALLEGLASAERSFRASQSEPFSRRAFSAAARPAIERFGDLQALEWIPRVSASMLVHFEAQAQASGLEGFRVKERKQGVLAPVDPREAYFPVNWVEPLQGNRAAVGFDLASNATRRAALELARDSAQPVVTGRLQLVQETGTQFGFLMFLPVFNGASMPTVRSERRGRLQGFTLSVVRIGDMFQSAVGGALPEGLAISLHDLDAPPTEAELFEFGSESQNIQIDWELQLPGRRWRLRASPSGAWMARHGSTAAWRYLALSLALTGVLCSMMLLYLRAANRKTDEAKGLASSLDERRIELEQLTLELKRRNTALSDFNHVVAHDLRAPARQILNFVGFLREDLYANLDGDQREWIDYIAKAGRRMQTTVDELLRFARIDGAVSDTTQVDLRALVESIVQDVDDGSSDLHFTIAALPVLRAPAELLRTLFQNLLENAAKYRDEAPQNIVVACTEDDAGKLVYRVSDTGIGIAEDSREKVFGMFARLHAESEFDGTGIGLASCRKVVTELGGEIWIEDNRPRGCIFCFTLDRCPVVRPPGADAR